MQFLAAKKQTDLSDNVVKNVFDLIRDDLELVETEFERQAGSNIQVINYLGNYLLETKGKRVRPALLILSTLAAGGCDDKQGMIRLATVMEMLHTATLVHDDIIDNADLRRNRSSLNAKFGNQAAVLMGDWLYMSAFETALEERSLEILDILTNLTRKMTEGEIMQLTLIGDVEISEEQYFDVLRRKTAYLFSGCCEIGALLAGADIEQQMALRDFGMNLGIAFQLADDLLDFTSDENAIGKPAGSDLLEGKMTLPLIKLVQSDGSARSMLENIMEKGEYQNGTRAEIGQVLQRFSILDSTRKMALKYGEAARKSLDVLPETGYRSALEAIPDFVVTRKK
ncbi:MAG: polyprenyl synthetase family protein [Acidobacteria bacterium]|nr:MAG: polyprenyl synthetase family protein [Acidobacteriota bacterium]